MKTLLFLAVAEDEDLQALLAGRHWSAGALGIDNIPANPEKPYMQTAMGDATDPAAVRETSKSQVGFARFYVYDERGSFDRINDIHRRLRDTLEGLSGTVSPSGRRCTEVQRVALGSEYTDATLDAAVRMATYRIVGEQ